MGWQNAVSGWLLLVLSFVAPSAITLEKSVASGNLPAVDRWFQENAANPNMTQHATAALFAAADEWTWTLADLDDEVTGTFADLAALRQQIASLLISHGADLSLLNPLYSGSTVLHVAASRAADVAFLKQLVSAGAPLDSRDAYERTPFLAAAKHGSGKALSYLRMANSDVSAVDVDGNSALHLAVLAGSLETINAVGVTAARIAATNRDGETPLTLAARLCSSDAVFDALLTTGSHVDTTAALMTAAAAHCDRLARRAATHARYVDAADVEAALLAGNPSAATLVQKCPEATASSGLLHAVLKQGNLAAARVLVQQGAHVDGQALVLLTVYQTEELKRQNETSALAAARLQQLPLVAAAVALVFVAIVYDLYTTKKQLASLVKAEQELIARAQSKRRYILAENEPQGGDL